jgi:hypothetical protein
MPFPFFSWRALPASGGIDLRAQVDLANLPRSDTPTRVFERNGSRAGVFKGTRRGYKGGKKDASVCSSAGAHRGPQTWERPSPPCNAMPCNHSTHYDERQSMLQEHLSHSGTR